MKDEEMAEQLAKEKLSKEDYKLAEEVIKPIYHNAIKNDYSFAKYGVECYLAGLKAGRPQWHDLRENPNDLPKDTVSVLISRGTPRTSRARYNGKWYGYYSDDEIEEVIAWCEIPTFDKE